MITITAETLLNAQELAEALRRNRRYVTEMKRKGFQMPGGTATLREARGWLARNPRVFTK